MKLRALRLHNVKRFAGRGIAIENIGDGVNVLTAANEYGKSTSFEALHALFFQPHSGTPGSVKLLRPYSGGNPLVEADIETAEGPFRVTKQFFGGRFARVTDLRHNRLIAQADEAEAFIAQLTRGGAGGPAGLLWVRQGVTGIEKRSSSEEEGERRVRETLLSSVQGEVEALTGGRRMDEIVTACDAALARLVTPTLRPKAGGPYQEALDEHERLQALEQQLASDVARLHNALDERRTISRRLTELEAPDEVAARDRELKAAEEDWQAARAHGETLRAAEARLALAQEQHRMAALEHTRFETALHRLTQLQAQAATATERLEAARIAHADAVSQSTELEAAVQAAEAAERQAREAKSRLDAATAARDAAERFDAANARLEEASLIRDRIERGEATLAGLLVPPKTLEQLDSLELELARQRALQAMALPSLSMSYADPAATAVRVGGEPLAHGEERRFTGRISVEIAQIGRLTIESHHTDKTAETIAATEDKLRRLLVTIGCDSTAAARRRQQAATEQSNALVLDRQLLKQLAPDGIEALRRLVTQLDAARSTDLEIKFDAAEIVEALHRAEAQVTASRHALREMRPVLEATNSAFVTANTAVTELQIELRALDATLGPAEDRPARRAAIEQRRDVCAQQLAAAEAEVEHLRAASEDFRGAELTLQRLRSVALASTQEIARHKEKLADLNGQIRIQADRAIEENWQETREQLAAAAETAQRYATEVKTLDRLRQALATARSSARDLYLKPVISELKPLIGLLFDDISVAFNESTLLPETVSRNGQEEEVDRLSGGMREQLSILTRLAFARLLARNGHPAPVILDDALVYSDDDRIERMFEALHSQSRDQQIIVFSCRQRAFSRLGGNSLTMSAWSPG